MIISICIGSACHLKGSYTVINSLQKLISEHGLENKVEIKAVFCLQVCGKGVSVKLDEEPVQFLTRDNVEDFFMNNVLASIKK